MAVMTQELPQRVSHFFRQHGLAGSKLVLAVSGGTDSVCLLHLLSNLKDELGLTLHVAHLDHRLRGDESRADAEYVSALAERLGVAATLGQADVKAYRKEKKLSLEEAAREVRYAFLAGVARSLGTRFIVTGHTLDDHVETVLLHIIRGSGTRGLAGLKPLTTRTVDNTQLTIVRPLFDIMRTETLEYCHRQGLEPRLDSSNFELSPLRNKIRLQLMPLLTRYNSNISGVLTRLSVTASDEMDYLDQQITELWERVARREGDVITLDKEALRCVHPALKRHLLRACFKQLLGNLKDIESRHIEEILAVIDKPAGRQISLPYRLVFAVGYDNYWLGKEDEIPCPFPAMEGERRLTVPGVTDMRGWRVETAIVKTFEQSDVNALVAYLDLDAVGQDFTVRMWKRSDRFQPLGLGAEKKLGEFMIDARVPRLWRHNIPIVVSAQHIVWLVGYRLDERAKVTSRTRRVLRLEFRRIPR